MKSYKWNNKNKMLYGAYDGTESHLPLCYGTAEEISKYLHIKIDTLRSIAYRADRNGKDAIVMKVGKMSEIDEEVEEE